MRKISNLDNYLNLSPSQLADTILDCPKCGKEHKIPFKIVKSDRNLIELIPDLMETILERKARRVGVVYDRQIEEKVSSFLLKLLLVSGMELDKIVLGEKNSLLTPSVEIGNKAVENLPEEIEFLIGVGSGVISDLTKWIATKCDLPFMLVGSAASMNAYTSITGTMTEDNIKTSRWLDPASIVLLDAELMSTAPKEMTCAGIGDLLARNISNADWKLSELIRGTFFCPVPYIMMMPYQDQYLAKIDSLTEHDPEAMVSLGNAVLVSGYSMSMLGGETSPSSGSEHILSHFFDFQHKIFDLPKNLHGTQVGVATIIMNAAFELLQEMDPVDFDVDDLERRRLSQTAINLDHRRVFGENGKKFDLVTAEKRISDVAYREYVSDILKEWESIWAEVDPYLMPSKRLRQSMDRAGAVTKLSGINRSAEETIQALLYGSHYRPRYSILDLFWELGLFPAIAPEILERADVL